MSGTHTWAHIGVSACDDPLRVGTPKGRDTGVPERTPVSVDRSGHMHHLEQQGPDVRGTGAYGTIPHKTAFRNSPLMGHHQCLLQNVVVTAALPSLSPRFPVRMLMKIWFHYTQQDHP